MAYASMKQMLETGVHFGHQTRRWNPKMRPYIFGARNGIHIIDLQQTVKMFATAHDFIVDAVAGGGKVLFVGTKRQAQDAVTSEAERAGMFYVTHRWMGGMLTNFQTIKGSIERLKELELMFEDGSISRFPKKEIVGMNREVTKLNSALGGIKDMVEQPVAAFIVDPKREHIAVAECRKLSIPIVAVVDTNCDPDMVDYIIPANDDAIRAIKLFSQHIADACLEGMAQCQEREAAKAEEEKAERAAAKARAAEKKPTPKKETKPAPAPKAEAKKAEAKKATPKKDAKPAPAPKAEGKKPAPEKDAPKKATPQKDAKPAPAPKAEVKKDEAKKTAPKKDAKPAPAPKAEEKKATPKKEAKAEEKAAPAAAEKKTKE